MVTPPVPPIVIPSTHKNPLYKESLLASENARQLLTATGRVTFH
jgi:hypothetical protein